MDMNIKLMNNGKIHYILRFSLHRNLYREPLNVTKQSII
ncbi:hypothetical protein CoNPh17_CDS0159 [Staphylococcus phage S-CoN_Ph17]|nr:hypothetical protein CoNPh17_CDS0159 [Staphylococcus phage S-CoN_Ph17]